MPDEIAGKSTALLNLLITVYKISTHITQRLIFSIIYRCQNHLPAGTDKPFNQNSA
jgi:hypothetical protein